jgi:hypothetical protein
MSTKAKKTTPKLKDNGELFDDEIEARITKCLRAWDPKLRGGAQNAAKLLQRLHRLSTNPKSLELGAIVDDKGETWLRHKQSWLAEKANLSRNQMETTTALLDRFACIERKRLTAKTLEKWGVDAKMKKEVLDRTAHRLSALGFAFFNAQVSLEALINKAGAALANEGSLTLTTTPQALDKQGTPALGIQGTPALDKQGGAALDVQGSIKNIPTQSNDEPNEGNGLTEGDTFLAPSAQTQTPHILGNAGKDLAGGNEQEREGTSPPANTAKKVATKPKVSTGCPESGKHPQGASATPTQKKGAKAALQAEIQFEEAHPGSSLQEMRELFEQHCAALGSYVAFASDPAKGKKWGQLKQIRQHLVHAATSAYALSFWRKRVVEFFNPGPWVEPIANRPPGPGLMFETMLLNWQYCMSESMEAKAWNLMWPDTPDLGWILTHMDTFIELAWNILLEGMAGYEPDPCSSTVLQFPANLVALYPEVFVSDECDVEPVVTYAPEQPATISVAGEEPEPITAPKSELVAAAPQEAASGPPAPAGCRQSALEAETASAAPPEAVVEAPSHLPPSLMMLKGLASAKMVADTVQLTACEVSAPAPTIPSAEVEGAPVVEIKSAPKTAAPKKPKATNKPKVQPKPPPQAPAKGELSLYDDLLLRAKDCYAKYQELKKANAPRDEIRRHVRLGKNLKNAVELLQVNGDMINDELEAHVGPLTLAGVDAAIKQEQLAAAVSGMTPAPSEPQGETPPQAEVPQAEVTPEVDVQPSGTMHTPLRAELLARLKTAETQLARTQQDFANPPALKLRLARRLVNNLNAALERYDANPAKTIEALEQEIGPLEWKSVIPYELKAMEAEPECSGPTGPK